jgi:dethiobiotin synthetase
MSPRFVISGTDTGIGKTVFSAALTHALQAYYWKPVQSGLDEETDSETVERLGGVPRAHPAGGLSPENAGFATSVGPP